VIEKHETKCPGASESLTLPFSGAAHGIENTHENCASRPPLERVVRPASLATDIALRGTIPMHSTRFVLLPVRERVYEEIPTHAIDRGL
jgi:hypothetical protein